MADRSLSRKLIVDVFIRVAGSARALDATPFLFLDDPSEIVFGFTLGGVFGGFEVLFDQGKDAFDSSAASHGFIDLELQGHAIQEFSAHDLILVCCGGEVCGKYRAEFW
jgi:hypothetical protein